MKQGIMKLTITLLSMAWQPPGKQNEKKKNGNKNIIQGNVLIYMYL